MRFIIHFLVVSIFLTFFSCDFHPTPKYVLMAYDLRMEFAEKIEKEKNLVPIGYIGGMMDNIKLLGVSFNTKGPLTVDRGRELLIYCVNEFINMINNDEEIRPYLQNYPFTAKNIEIRIFCDNTPPSLAYVGSVKGRVSYDYYDGKIINVKKETFEEAERILAKEESSNNSDFSK